MLKIVAISDTHNRHNQIKAFLDIDSFGEEKEPLGGDVLVHSGDATGRGETWEVRNFLEWMGKQDFVHKIYVPGNHDWACERQPALVEQYAKDNGVILLNDSGVEIEGIKFWGSPVQPWFYSWAFNRARDLNEAMFRQIKEIKPHWDLIPEGTNVLITHGPPYEILDEVLTVSGESYAVHNMMPRYVGCVELLAAIKRIKPDIHIFGHIHCGYGEKHVDGTSFYNASICDEMYMPSNAPHIIMLPKKQNP